MQLCLISANCSITYSVLKWSSGSCAIAQLFCKTSTPKRKEKHFPFDRSEIDRPYSMAEESTICELNSGLGNANHVITLSTSPHIPPSNSVTVKSGVENTLRCPIINLSEDKSVISTAPVLKTRLPLTSAATVQSSRTSFYTFPSFARVFGYSTAERYCKRTMSWHSRAPWLATACIVTSTSLDQRIHIYDFEGKIPVLGQSSRHKSVGQLPPWLLLEHEFQRDIMVVSWRPHAAATLAVGCSGGICIWNLEKAPRISVPTPRRVDGNAGLQMTFLPCQATEKAGSTIVAIDWHPRGHLLASSCSNSATVHVWDVSTACVVAVRDSAFLDSVVLLRWSPCGSYLFVGHASGAFKIWETDTWWSEHWSPSSATAGRLIDACWSPDARSVFIAHANSFSLSSLHFTAKPPSLSAQILPLLLPELDCNGTVLERVAWDPRGQRLALALSRGCQHPAAGHTALYDIRSDPVPVARFIGYLKTDLGSGEVETDLVFKNSFKQGALLSVKQGESIRTIPMYFS